MMNLTRRGIGWRAGVLALCLGVCGIAGAQLTSVFRSPDGRISFWAPVKPRTLAEQVPGKGKTTYQQTTFAMEGPNYLLLASVLELGRGPPATGDEESFLGGMLDSLRAGMGNKFALDQNGDTRIKYRDNGFPGRQIRGTIDGRHMTIRTFVAAKRIYTFQVGHMQGDKEAAALAERFLSSVIIDDREPANAE